MKNVPPILFIACFLAIWTPANAAMLTFEFSGTVTQVPVDDIFGDIAAGDAIQGSYIFDTSALDLIPSDPATGVFNWSAPAGSISVTVGTHDFSATELTIGILNSFIDQYTVLGLSSAGGDLSLELFLQDNTGSVFANDGLPAAAPPLPAFAQRDFHLRAVFGGGELQVDGQLNALAAQQVPEPSPSGLILAGAAILVMARRRRA